MIKYQNMDWYDYKLMRNLDRITNQVPVMLRLYTTTDCNSKCYFCSNVSPESAVMDIDFACSIIDRFAEAGGKSVQFSGGEPTLYPGWARTIETCRQNRLDWAFFTNGTKLKKVMSLSSTKGHIPDWLRVSLDAGFPNTYRKIHNNCWETVLEGIEYVVKEFPNTVIGTSFVICEKNYNDIPAFTNLSKSLGVKYCRITYARDIDEDNSKWDNELNHLFYIAEAMANDDFEVVTLRDRKILHKPSLGLCHYSNVVITVGADGYIYPCCLSLYDYEKRLVDLKKGIHFDHTVNTSLCPNCDKDNKNLCMASIIQTSSQLGWKREHYNFL